jgi:aminoglycoside 3-N-acetyltransferase
MAHAAEDRTGGLPRRSSPQEIASPVGHLATTASIAAQLHALGVRPGKTLLVHASMRAVGWVCGGALSVVQALLDVVGATGTLVAPTFTADNRDPSRWVAPSVPPQWWPTIREHLPVFDPAITPSQGMGAIAEQLRGWPGALRSSHPQVSFVALGPQAGFITADHPLTCHLGERSPLRRLEDVDAQVLLLGVGWERCTAFHLGEYRQPDPPRRLYSCVTLTEHGRAWVTFDDVDLDQCDFRRLGEAFEASCMARTTGLSLGTIGAGNVRLFTIRGAVRFAEDWLRQHRGPGSDPSR